MGNKNIIFKIIISLIFLIFSGKIIYNKINLYLYGDKIEISEIKKTQNDNKQLNNFENQIDTQTTNTVSNTNVGSNNDTKEQKNETSTKAKKTVITYSNSKAKKVKITASFLSWKEKDMKKENNQWVFETYIKDPGIYKYYFIVDGKKVLDSKAKKTEDGKYSILEIK